MSMSVFGLGMVAWFFFRCVGRNFEGCDGILPGPLAFILTLLGVFEGFLFSLFTCIMFCSQVHAIATDETVRKELLMTPYQILVTCPLLSLSQGIESLKKESRERTSWFVCLFVVM